MRVPLAHLIVVSATLFAQTDRPKTYWDENKAWFKTNPPPQANASPEQRRAFDQQLADATAEWVKHWPDTPQAWLYRLKSLSRLKSTSDHQLEETGDMVLKVANEHPPGGFRFKPFQTEVAMIWTMRNIRPEQCLQLTQEAVREDERAQSDNPSAARQFMVVVAQGLFNTLELERYLAVRLNKFEIAESAVDHMKQYLDQYHPDHPKDRARLEYRYLANAGYEAEAEGHKLDALLYLSQAFRESPEDSSAETHASQLWKELGGTEEGFNAWTFTIARIDRTPPAMNQDRSPWTAMDKPLTAFRGTGTNGKVWTIEDLKGKTTLINVWATWCRPCQDELPSIQTIFDQLKDRKDVQLLTVSVDDDFTWIARFAERQHYTFPIIAMTSAAVDKMVGVEGVPRTWIVDLTGSVRFEAIGYDPAALSADQILHQLAALK
ncbi:MAG: TlpA family protein disulfide reductase [Acidobacteriota bacterium]|nr:TlpA family protein disulfide reductase [Acidobacteriota bacterium]